MPLLSVVVCTYNRAELLRKVVESLCRQNCDRMLYEVVVVDNNSCDATRDVVGQFKDQAVRYVFEERQGLSCARNRGCLEANGEYIAYIDDDAVAPEQWLATAVNIIGKQTPAAFGGPYYPYYTGEKPSWFKDEYASQGMGKSAKQIKGPGLSGGNFFIKRELLVRAGCFDETLGVKGGDLGYGEETALLKHISETMPFERIYYDPDLYVYHIVKPQRMSLVWNMRHFFLSGCFSFRFLASDREKTGSRKSIIILDIVKTVRDFVASISGAVFMRDRRQFPHWESCFFEQALPHVKRIGWLFEELKCACRNGLRV